MVKIFKIENFFLRLTVILFYGLFIFFKNLKYIKGNFMFYLIRRKVFVYIIDI